MTIRVEDGTIVANANSYVTAAEFVSYESDRGNTTNAEADTDQIEFALIKGADFLGQKYRHRWKGSRVNSQQALDWPRRGVDVPDFFDPFFKQANVPISFQDTLFIGENVVPQEVKDAQIQVAAATMDSSGISSGVLQPALGRATKREKLGPLEVEYFNAEDGSSRLTTVYWDAEQRLWAMLLASAPFSGRMVRS